MVVDIEDTSGSASWSSSSTAWSGMINDRNGIPTAPFMCISQIPRQELGLLNSGSPRVVEFPFLLNSIIKKSFSPGQLDHHGIQRAGYRLRRTGSVRKVLQHPGTY